MNCYPVDTIIMAPSYHTYGKRTKPIKKIAIHHVAGVISAVGLGNFFASGHRQASSNYGIGNDLKVGLYVPEDVAAWTTSSSWCDQQAITIEVSNSKYGDIHGWPVSDAVIEKLIDLCVYICRKYGIKDCSYTGGKDGVLQMHRWYAATSCPGPYLAAKFEYISKEINKRLAIEQKPFVGLAIAGKPQATPEQMNAYLKSVNPNVETKYLDLAKIFIEEGKVEGIRGDIAYAQSLIETGNFKFGGDVKPGQNNFAGIGATGGGIAGNSFKTPREGIRAQIQHLKAYANSEPLKQENVDPRFKYVTRGVAPYVEWLGIQENPQRKGWAVAANYGDKITSILNKILGEKPVTKPVEAVKPIPKPTPKPQEGKVHIVVKGDSLYAIAQKYLGDGMRYPEIKKLNGLTSDLIYPGQVIKIAGGNPVVTHIVVSGDTLWDIAEKYLGYGARYREIKSLNGLDSDDIYPGQELKINASGTTESKTPVKKPVQRPASSNQKIIVGSIVKIKMGSKDWNGNRLLDFVYLRNHKVSELSGKRAVLTYGGVVVAAVSTDNLYLV